jgi:hypothetical protein
MRWMQHMCGYQSPDVPTGVRCKQNMMKALYGELHLLISKNFAAETPMKR